MKQITVKRAVEAWHWIVNNPHHIVGTEFHPVLKDSKGHAAVSHVYFQNYFEKMRVPASLQIEVMNGLRPNRRAFDTRMFALRKHAKLAVTR